MPVRKNVQSRKHARTLVHVNSGTCCLITTDVRFSGYEYISVFENAGTVSLCVESLVEEERRVFLFSRTGEYSW